MKRSRRGRWALIGRGVLLLAAVLLLPLAVMVQAPRQTTAQTAAQRTAQDSLWAAGGDTGNAGVAACADPSSSASLSGCFASFGSTWPTTFNQAAATDGVNVYFASKFAGALRCPIADLGTNCTRIMAGPWPYSRTGVNFITSLAAANGFLWIGQANGDIYRCPADLPYADQDTAPSQCVLLDQAGSKRGVWSLVLANGTLYAGLGSHSSQPGLLWSCSPDTVNACSTLDSYGSTTASSLAAGGGYLWAGLGNGIIWRCDLNAANACDDWEKAGDPVNSISYDGRGTLYAAIYTFYGVVWSCPTAYRNGCSKVLSRVEPISVAAGAGNAFSSLNEASGSVLYYGSSPFTSASYRAWNASALLYLPADGPAGVGGVKVAMTAKSLGKKLEKRCIQSGKTARATVTVTGPHGFEQTLKTGICGVLNGGIVKKTFNLLDPGQYIVTAKAGKHSGKASFTIVQDTTKPVNVKLKRGS
jgi:hypothetical protein